MMELSEQEERFMRLCYEEVSEYHLGKLIAACQKIRDVFQSFVQSFVDALASALMSVADVIHDMVDSEVFQRGVLAMHLSRCGRVGDWLSVRLPIRVVRWLNQHWPEG